MAGKPKITDDDARLLGTAPDHVIADRLGVTQQCVTRHRRLRGIPSYDRRTIESVTVAQLRLLGKDTDGAIGKILGIPAEYVRRLRVEFGIPPFGPPGFRSRARAKKKGLTK